MPRWCRRSLHRRVDLALLEARQPGEPPREVRVPPAEQLHRRGQQHRARTTVASIRIAVAYASRHSFASLLIAAGVNAKAVSTYLGHASIYGHLMPGNENIADLVERFLAGDQDYHAPGDGSREREAG
jgi:integrase